MGITGVTISVEAWEVLCSLAEDGLFPPDMNLCEIADLESGITLAHSAALGNRLPALFSQWRAADKDGTTVAHVAAAAGHLPKRFKQWALADKHGVTVAHVAAAHGHLPKNFNQWELTNGRGQTVREVYEKWRAKNA
jgi:hypothetical protein